ncbi:MAG: YsnF/AvaK domain-containing protein [Chloroflexota bacterium]|nr:MAG: hypothetical protein DIU68_06890 [Chloroflexota bacterium]
MRVTDRDGHSAYLETSVGEAPDERALLRLEDGQALVVSRDVLETQPDGSLYLPLSFDELARASRSGEEVFPVIEERLDIAKREVERPRFRIVKSVSERDVLVDEPLMQEQVDIERVVVNQMVDEPPAVRYEGDTMVVPLLEEVVVVDVRLIVREEVRITRRRDEVSAPRRVTLRREDVTVVPVADDRDGETDAQ